VAVACCVRLAAAHPAVTKPCKDCHADVHRGELGARDCGTCHATAAWTPSTYGAAQHARYPLDGRHVATPCGGCHLGRPRVTFVIPQSACLDCHENPHGTKFPKEMVESGCAGCHTTGTWKTWRADHTAWPLTGGHTRTPCVSCHPGRAEGDAAAAFRGVPRGCDKCHDDTHAAQFRAAPAKACTDCHATGSWRAPFDHSKAKLAVDGAHAALACARCHPAVPLRNGQQSVRYRLGYAACRDCHANPHPRITAECNTCHVSTSWHKVAGSSADFDHRTTGFALRGRHATTTCASCHDKGVRPPNTCGACHRDTHQGRMNGACAECHTPIAWADVRVFEQHRRTRMPLTGKHAAIECTACHRRQGERKWSDLPIDCYSCHEARYRTAQPDHVGAQPFSRDCALCHVTIAWKPAIDPSLLRVSPDHAAFSLTGSHSAAECAACHVDTRRRKLVRCDGCHTVAKLRSQHRTPVANVAPDCLRCHPRGARR